MKDKYYILGGILVILIATLFLSFETYKEENKEIAISSKIEKEYSFLENDNKIHYLNSKDFDELYTKGNGIFLLCHYEFKACQDIMRIVNENEHNTINYYDILNDRDEISMDTNDNIIKIEDGSYIYKKLLKILDDFLPKYSLLLEDKSYKKIDEKRLYMPTLIYLKEGTIIDIIVGDEKSELESFKIDEGRIKEFIKFS